MRQELDGRPCRSRGRWGTPTRLLRVLFWSLLFGIVGAGWWAADATSSEGSAADSSPSAQESVTGEGPAESEGLSRRQTILTSLTIFVLAIFVGFEVITKVPPTLHTPLMSGSNAISGITIVGAILVAGTAAGVETWIGFAAVVLAAINVFGGFLVTHRMLAMFQRR